MDVLHVEDDKSDSFLVLHKLSKCWSEINYCRVDEIGELKEALKKKWDVILCDFELHEFDGTMVLTIIQDNGIKTPVIMVSGRSEDDILALTKGLGAAGYIPKDNLKNLVPAISRALKSGNRDSDSPGLFK